MKISIEVNRSHEREKAARLGREATALKSSGDMDVAIQCLREVKRLMVANPSGCTVQQWLRLPLYLQLAGRFDEAMGEFQELLASPPLARDLRATGRRLESKDVLNMLLHSDFAAIYDKMRLACRREGLTEEAEQYRRLADEHDLGWQRLNEKVNC